MACRVILAARLVVARHARPRRHRGEQRQPTGAVASTASATARERNGPISASASGSLAASSAARIVLGVAVRDCSTPGSAASTAAVSASGRTRVDAHYSV